MWKLDKPDTTNVLDHIDLAFNAVKSVTYPISFAEKLAIKNIYRIYDSQEGIANPDFDQTKFQPGLLTAIASGYSQMQKKRRLAKVRETLLLNAKRCPCCGIIAATTLDHHLPISSYEIFGIYTRNLVAYCHICNNLKRTVKGFNPNERFIHPYFSNIPVDKQFLFANVNLSGKSLQFELEIRQIPELHPQLKTQMEFMMKRVDLKNRLMDELNVYFISLSTYIQSDYERGGKVEVSKSLKKNAEKQKIDFGVNHWRYAVILALSEHDQFCDGGFYAPWGLSKTT